jgi:hypothetical protein
LHHRTSRHNGVARTLVPLPSLMCPFRVCQFFALRIKAGLLSFTYFSFSHHSSHLLSFLSFCYFVSRIHCLLSSKHGYVQSFKLALVSVPPNRLPYLRIHRRIQECITARCSPLVSSARRSCSPLATLVPSAIASLQFRPTKHVFATPIC